VTLSLSSKVSIASTDGLLGLALIACRPELQELGISDSIPFTEYFPFRARTPLIARGYLDDAEAHKRDAVLSVLRAKLGFAVIEEFAHHHRMHNAGQGTAESQ
jgi:hypothetical protein